MQVHALFFAAYRERVGHTRFSIALPEGARARELVDALRRQGPPFDGLPEAPSVAVNEAWAALDTELNHDDVVAFIPPVAGG